MWLGIPIRNETWHGISMDVATLTCLFVAGVTVSQAGLRGEAKASPYARSATILWPDSFMAASPRCFPYTTVCLLDTVIIGIEVDLVLFQIQNSLDLY